MQCGIVVLTLVTSLELSISLIFELDCECFAVGGDTKETPYHSTRWLCTGSRVRPGCLSAGLLVAPAPLLVAAC